MVSQHHVDELTGALELGELAHSVQVRHPLPVQVRLGRLAKHQGEGHLGEQHRLQVRLRLDRIGQPGTDLGPAGVGDRVVLALRPVTAKGKALRRDPEDTI
jgi:hypothetical protein